MRHCINFRHPDVVLLAKEISMPAFIVANMIAVWQEKNKIFDRFPNAEEVLTVKEEPSARALPFEQAIAEFKRKYHVKEIYRDYETVSKMIKTARKNGKYDHIHFGIDKNSTGFWPTYNRKDEFYSLSPSVNYGFKAVEVITKNLAKVESWFTKLKNTDAFWTKLQQDLQIPKHQIELLKQSEGSTVGEKLANFIANYSYTVEINTAKDGKIYEQYPDFDENGFPIEGSNNTEERTIQGNTNYYSNLTVPGGTNYTENEISIPGQLVEEKPQGVPAKEGVPELFESNPELANSVYEALGFINKQELENLKKQFSSFSNIRDKFKGNLKDVKNVVDFFTQVAADVNFYKPFTTDISEQRKKDIISGKATSYIWEDSFDNYRKTIEKSLNDELESEKDRYNYWFDNGVDFYTLDVESGKYYKYKSNATVTPLEKQYEVTKKEYYEALDNYKDDLKEKNIQEQEEVKENVLRQPFLEGKIVRLFDNHFVIVTNHTIKEEGDSFINEIEFIYYDEFNYDRLKELEKQKITPQQKQQALQLYSQYLDTIFPYSKVKDIVYKGTTQNKEFTKIEPTFFTSNPLTASTYVREGLNEDEKWELTISQEELENNRKELSQEEINKINKRIEYLLNKEKYKGSQISVILNSKNITTFKDASEFTKNGNQIKELNKLYEQGFDTAIIKDSFDTSWGGATGTKGLNAANFDRFEQYLGTTYVVFKPEQIHILGSRQDIEGFKNFVSNNNNTIKQGVSEIFNSNSELSNIGTQEQYSQYLDTIFPDSQIKDIVYHGTDLSKDQITFKSERGGIFLASTPIYASYFSEQDNAYPALIDFNNIYQAKGLTDNIGKEEINTIKSKGFDSVIGKGGISKMQQHQNDLEYIAFNSEQIHILGSKQDIEGFKSFIKSNTKTVRKGAILPSIKGHAAFSSDSGIGWFRSDDKHAFTGFLEDLIASGTIKKVPC